MKNLLIPLEDNEHEALSNLKDRMKLELNISKPFGWKSFILQLVNDHFVKQNKSNKIKEKESIVNEVASFLDVVGEIKIKGENGSFYKLSELPSFEKISSDFIDYLCQE